MSHTPPQFVGGLLAADPPANPTPWGAPAGAVELVGRRTPTSKTFVHADGRTFTLAVTPTTLHTARAGRPELVTRADWPAPPPRPRRGRRRPAASASDAPAGTRVYGDSVLSPAAADDGQVTATGASYPPSPAGRGAAGSAGTAITPSRSLAGGTYTVTVGLVRFDTGALPAGAAVSSALLRLNVLAAGSADGRTLAVEWLTDAASRQPGTWITTAEWTATSAATAGTRAISGLTVGADNDVTLSGLGAINAAGFTALRLHVDGGTPAGVNSVQIAAVEHATAPEPRLVLTYTFPSTAAAVTASYAASATVAGTAVAGLTPGLSGGSAYRALARFPLLGQLPPLARITKVQLTGTVSAPGAGGGTWSIHPYGQAGGGTMADGTPQDRVFADPEADPFATQYTQAATLPAYVSADTTFRTGGGFALDLSAQAVTDVQAAMAPEYGYLALGIEEDGGDAAPPSLTGLGLTISYDVPLTPALPLHDLAQVQLLGPDIPHQISELELTDYALRATIRWQAPGAIELAVPKDSVAAAKLLDMSVIALRVRGVPVLATFKESASTTRDADMGDGGAVLKVSGQSLHRVLGNRITGPFPAGFNYESGSLAATEEVEIVSAGDVSTRGAAYGGASTSAESVMRRLIAMHTTAAPSARQDAWTRNLALAPDGRRGASPIEVRTKNHPLLADVQSICEKADCGYGVWLTASGRYRWAFLPGVDRTAGAGAWFLSPDVTRGVSAVEADTDLTQLVTHAYVLSSPTEGSGRLMSVRTQGGAGQYMRREVAVDAGQANSAAAVALEGDAYLAQHTYRRTLRLTLDQLLDAGWLSAWNVGDKLLVADPETGIAEPVRVYEIAITIGPDELVSALIDEPSVQPLLIALATGHAQNRAAGREPQALVQLVTGPAPPARTDTWKETRGAALRGPAMLPGLSSSVAEINQLSGTTPGAAVPSRAVIAASDGKVQDSQIAALAAAKVTGQLTDSQIADIAAAKLTGQLTDSQIAALAAAKLTGQLSDAQIAAVAAAKITGTFASPAVLAGVTATAADLNRTSGIENGATANPRQSYSAAANQLATVGAQTVAAAGTNPAADQAATQAAIDALQAKLDGLLTKYNALLTALAAGGANIISA